MITNVMHIISSDPCTDMKKEESIDNFQLKLSGK